MYKQNVEKEWHTRLIYSLLLLLLRALPIPERTFLFCFVSSLFFQDIIDLLLYPQGVFSYFLNSPSGLLADHLQQLLSN